MGWLIFFQNYASIYYQFYLIVCWTQIRDRTIIHLFIDWFVSRILQNLWIMVRKIQNSLSFYTKTLFRRIAFTVYRHFYLCCIFWLNYYFLNTAAIGPLRSYVSVLQAEIVLSWGLEVLSRYFARTTRKG